MMRVRTITLSAAAVAAVLLGYCWSAQAEAGENGASAGGWTGLRVGVTGGYAGGDVSYKGRLASEDESGTAGLRGGMVGGLIGYDHEFSNGFVLGGVADLSWLGLSGSDCLGASGCQGKLEADVDMLGTLRARVGYAMDDFMFYATGGLALGHVDISTDGLPGGGGSDSSFGLGWTLGAGIEYRLSEPVTIGLEYLYVDLGEQNYSFSGGHVDASVNMQLIRASLSYKF